MVISEPPGADRWDEAVLARLGVRRVIDPLTAPLAEPLSPTSESTVISTAWWLFSVTR